VPVAHVQRLPLPAAHRPEEEGLGRATGASERGRVYTLGDFLDVWGEPDLASVMAGRDAGMRTVVWVNGQPYAGDPRSIPLRDGTDILVAASAPPGGSP
jgi:hypothetical protein